eukprot:scaffold35982_cov40-Phaeocystis_antarctica.AAC.1
MRWLWCVAERRNALALVRGQATQCAGFGVWPSDIMRWLWCVAERRNALALWDDRAAQCAGVVRARACVCVHTWTWTWTWVYGVRVKGRWRVTCGCGASVDRLSGAARGRAFGHVQRRVDQVRPMQWER